MQIDHHLILVDERKKEYFKNRLTFIWIAQWNQGFRLYVSRNHTNVTNKFFVPKLYIRKSFIAVWNSKGYYTFWRLTRMSDSPIESDNYDEVVEETDYNETVEMEEDDINFEDLKQDLQRFQKVRQLGPARLAL